nr:MAG TPA: hypothetical protein [Caudoviricetes sp.]
MIRGVLRAKVSEKVSAQHVGLWDDGEYRRLSQCKSQRCTEQMGRGE